MTSLYCCLLVLAKILVAVSDVAVQTVDERPLLELLNRYIQQQEKEINALKTAALRLRQEASETNASQSSSDPVVGFKVIRRLVRDWEEVRNLVTSSGPEDEFKREWRNIERELITGEGHLEEATQNLIWELDAPHSTNIAELTALECYELGRFLYDRLDFSGATRWFNEALARYDPDQEFESDSRKKLKWKVYDYLPLSLFHEGKKEAAFNLNKNIIAEFDMHEEAHNNQQLMEEATGKASEIAEHFKEVSEIFEDERGKIFNAALIRRFEQLCRREIVSNVDLHKLKCRYVVTSPYTRLARLKEEEVLLNPRVVAFRDVIHDSEIEIIKDVITPKMQRGIVANNTGIPQYTPHRIAKQFTMPEADEVVRKIHRRAEDMSRLSTESAESVNVVNYGLGGHYHLHFDHSMNYRPGHFPAWNGNRLASMLFYLSDVDIGGQTAFPALNLTVAPEKGSAILWRDLHFNGEGDLRMVHASCPVFQGSKWVITFFLHTVGNELRQPCKLSQHE